MVSNFQALPPLSPSTAFESRLLKLEQAPAIDQALYAKALSKAKSLLSGGKTLGGLRPATRVTDLGGYGSYLNFLLQHGALDPDIPPGDRINAERVNTFVEALELAGLAPKSIGMYLSGTYRTLKYIHPERDWRWLCELVERVLANAVPVVDKHGLPSVGALYWYGLELYESAEAADIGENWRARQVRNSLMIILPAARPLLRPRNLFSLRFEQHLYRDGDRYHLSLDGSERKAKKAVNAPLPTMLTPILDRYRNVHRPRLVAQAGFDPKDSSLWVGTHGTVLNKRQIRVIVGRLTFARFHRRISPHNFRHATASSFAHEAPEYFHQVPHVLDHATLAMSEEYVWFCRHNLAVKKLDKSLLKLESMS